MTLSAKHFNESGFGSIGWLGNGEQVWRAGVGVSLSGERRVAAVRLGRVWTAAGISGR